MDGEEVSGITTSLRPSSDDVRGQPLNRNHGRQFFGVVQSGDGFILTETEATALRARTEADYPRVVKPFLVGDDITSNPLLEPSRWIIDFADLPLEEAMKWPAALEIVRERVKPLRDAHSKRREREQWWKFSRAVPALFAAVKPLQRFIACPATAKRFYMVWCEKDWVPSNAVSVFALDDDFAIGVLSSRIHTRWATDQIDETRDAASLYDTVLRQLPVAEGQSG